MATIQLAVFEAVNSITGKYEPYLGTISAPAGASPEAAAITAARDTLTAFFGQSMSLDELRDASLAAIPDGQAKTDGISVGHAAAAAMIANRTGDGSAPPMFYTPMSERSGSKARRSFVPSLRRSSAAANTPRILMKCSGSGRQTPALWTVRQIGRTWHGSTR
jgi:hypothetical protein